MKKIVALAACIAISFSLGVNAQNSDAANLEELKAAGYPELRPFSFLAMKKKLAMTALYKSKLDKNPQIFTANISPDKEGASVYFQTFRLCTPTDKRVGLEERIIMVSSQKIEALYMCGIAPGQSNTTEIFMIKSASGHNFVKKEFTERNYVFVHLNGLPVPFHTEGFSQVITELSGKAL